MPVSIARWAVWKALHVNSVSFFCFWREVLAFIELDKFYPPLQYLLWALCFWVQGGAFCVVSVCVHLVSVFLWVWCGFLVGFFNR